MLPPPGIPPAGTISGTARLGTNSITGLFDTMIGDLTSGEFRIEGIPVPPGSIARYAIFVEPMPAIGVGQGSLGEWWFEAVMNPVLNIWPLYTQALPDVMINNAGFPLVPSGAFQVGNLDLAQGSIVNLTAPITLGGGIQLEVVSRPVVQLPPAARTMNPQGTNVTVTISHNYNVTPRPLRTAAILNGAPLVQTPGATTGGPVGVAPFTTFVVVTMPASIPPGSVFRFTAIETRPNPGLPTVMGVNEVRY